MSNKLTISIFIIAFWVMYPAMMMLMDDSTFQDEYVPGTSVRDNVEGITLLNFISKTTSLLGSYFKIFFLGIPEAGFWANRFINIMQLVSGLVVILLIRGD